MMIDKRINLSHCMALCPIGETDELLDGLYVVDGAILPRSVGVNPTFTIGCLAERCIRLLAEREGWHIDNDSFKPLGKRQVK